MPTMPESILNKHTNSVMTIAELMNQVPLDKFIFEGISVIRVNDMTEQEVITQIKNRLLDTNAFSDASVYTELEKYVQMLIDGGAKLYACKMSVDMFGLKQHDFVEGIEGIVTASDFMDMTEGAQIIFI